MTITEAERHRLYQRLEDVLGPDDANTLMQHLPPVGWADVATRRDLELYAELARRDLETTEHRLRAEIADLRTDMHSSMRVSALAIIGANVAITGIAMTVLAVVR